MSWMSTVDKNMNTYR